MEIRIVDFEPLSSHELEFLFNDSIDDLKKYYILLYKCGDQ